MIIYILLGLHVVLSIALILIVLLQTGKGSDLASAFGGGGAGAVFGGAGPTSFLNKMTTAVAVLFMVTSIALAYVGTGSRSIMPDQGPSRAPAAGVEQDEIDVEDFEFDFEMTDGSDTEEPAEAFELPPEMESEPLPDDAGIEEDSSDTVLAEGMDADSDDEDIQPTETE